MTTSAPSARGGAAPVVVDTDLVIDFLRDRGPGAALVEDLGRASRLRITAVTAFELASGDRFPGQEHAIQVLLARGAVPLDRDAALRAGEVFRALRAAGQGIGVPDTLQAGCCLQRGFALATRNRRHFERVPGLVLHPSG